MNNVVDISPVTFGPISDTDMANARRLALHYGKDLHFTAGAGWLYWDGRRWARDEKEVQIQAWAKETVDRIFDELRTAGAKRDEIFAHAKRSQSARAVGAMILLTRSEPGIPAKITDFDADPWLLNAGNGTLDLRTGTLRTHARENKITRIVPINFDAYASCPRWETFLAEITGGDAELQNYLWRVIGYSLTGLTREQVLHFFHGSGANGKSVFSEVVQMLLGDYAIVASPEMIMAKRHASIPNDIARLRGVRVAMMNETSQGARFDEQKLKDLTGGDSLTGRFLHAEFFDFSPNHKIMIRGNHKPVIYGTDDGIWRRMRMVPFTVSVPPEKQDRDLLGKLTAELPGILAWAVRGCTEWQRIGLNAPDVVAAAVAEYREESDTLGRFIDEHCELRPSAQVKSSALFAAYQAYAERGGERWIRVQDLPLEMQRRGFEWKRTKSGGMFFGIELKSATVPNWSERNE